MTLVQRVEQALETAGIPKAGGQRRGYMSESSRGIVRLYWGYGEPALKVTSAQSSLGQCYHLLVSEGFSMQQKMFKDRESYIEVLG
ncbi:MAG: hypothetical protein ACKVVP_05570 [Chloroflexota bacterium]